MTTPLISLPTHASRRGWVVLTALLLIAVMDVISRPAGNSIWPPGPVFWGLLAVLIYLMIGALVTGRANPLIAAIGADGRLSTSKFQFFLWTGVVVFTYVWIFA